MKLVQQGPVRARVHGGDIVDYEVVSKCSRLELEAALVAIKERCGAEQCDSFIEQLAAELGFESLFDDPEKLIRGVR